jgi:hypothetical protein
MILEKRLITPEIAADMLTRNFGNRPFRSAAVKAYAMDMKAGRWRLTHEAIAVTTAGNLINGQHRLRAIVESGCQQMFWIAVYDTTETATDLPIDFGARRTVSDILGQDKLHVQTAAALYRFGITHQGIEVRPHQVRAILDIIGREIDDAVNVSRSRVKLRGSAMARSAVVCNMLRFRHDEDTYDDIVDSFRAWVEGANAKWTSVETLNKQAKHMEGLFSQNTFCRVLYAFNPKNRDVKCIRIAPEQERAMLKELRSFLQSQLPDICTPEIT